MDSWRSALQPCSTEVHYKTSESFRNLLVPTLWLFTFVVSVQSDAVFWNRKGRKTKDYELRAFALGSLITTFLAKVASKIFERSSRQSHLTFSTFYNCYNSSLAITSHSTQARNYFIIDRHIC